MLSDLVCDKKPDFIFLAETFSYYVQMNAIKISLGYSDCFVVPKDGHRSGLAFLSKKPGIAKLLDSHDHFIDVKISITTI